MKAENSEEINKLRAEIEAFKSELIGVLSKTDSSFENFRTAAADSIIFGELMKAKNALSEKADNCPHKEACIANLMKTYEALLENLKASNVTTEKISTIKKEFEEAQKICTFENCGGCLIEADRLFACETKLLKSAGVYHSDDAELKIQSLDDDKTVSFIGEPLSNAVRIKILKSLASEPKSFADLSKITNLKGGNLLFHLDKLSQSSMILQKAERKEYTITSRGRELLKTAAELIDKF